MGLHGANAGELFDQYCQDLVEAGVALLRGHVSTQTLHPQWTGYGYTWHRRLNSVQEQFFERAEAPLAAWLESPFLPLIERARSGDNNAAMRRRLTQGPEQRDFPILEEFYAEGATDYYSIVFGFGRQGDAAHGGGIALSFLTDAPQGFSDEEITLIEATLPGVALALKAHAGYAIASNLLGAYLGHDAGRRVHAGAVVRGTTTSLNAVIWFADLRGFTTISDNWPGPAIVDMLDDAFECLTAPVRARNGQVLKFIGDAMLVIFPIDEEPEAKVCLGALEAAEEALLLLKSDNRRRADAGLPIVEADIALHIGEVLYGNIGAADRLDFTVIGPAVNEAARIEKMCDALDLRIVASERFARKTDLCGSRLVSLGPHSLRGVSPTADLIWTG